MPAAIIIGASSGIGAALAQQLANDGWQLGLMARRTDAMESIAKDFPVPATIRYLDLSDYTQSMEAFRTMVADMGAVDVVIANSGINFLFPDATQTEAVIRVNVLGLVGCMEHAKDHFLQQGYGHLVCITSIAGIRGSGPSPVYGASKAFLINYLEGLRKQVHRKGHNLSITDVRPGYVATDMTAGQKGLFWLTPQEEAARQIRQAIAAKKQIIYVSPRWKLVALVLRLIPYSLYKHVGG